MINEEAIKAAPAGSSEANNAWEATFLQTATRDFLHEERLFNSVNGVVSDGITQDRAEAPRPIPTPEQGKFSLFIFRYCLGMCVVPV